MDSSVCLARTSFGPTSTLSARPSTAPATKAAATARVPTVVSSTSQLRVSVAVHCCIGFSSKLWQTTPRSHAVQVRRHGYSSADMGAWVLAVGIHRPAGVYQSMKPDRYRQPSAWATLAGTASSATHSPLAGSSFHPSSHLQLPHELGQKLVMLTDAPLHVLNRDRTSPSVKLQSSGRTAPILDTSRSLHVSTPDMLGHRPIVATARTTVATAASASP